MLADRGNTSRKPRARLAGVSRRSSITFAREYLRSIDVAKPQLEYLCENAIRAGVQGNRGEIFAAEVRRMTAAISGGHAIPPKSEKQSRIHEISPCLLNPNLAKILKRLFFVFLITDPRQLSGILRDSDKIDENLSEK